MQDSTDEIVALLAVIGLGLVLGRIPCRGITLGTSGVVFVALAAGHFGFRVPRNAGVAGIVLFVYCLGIGAGPSFLRMFFRRGKSLAVMAVSMILSACLVAWIMASTLGLSPALAGGLFAGALTSTPALAAATDRLPAETEVAVGFGVAYPFGVIGVILFVQLVPRFFARYKDPAFAEDGTGSETNESRITRVVVDVSNPGVLGKRLRDVATIAHANCQVPRILVDGRMQPTPASLRLEMGQRVLVVGAEDRIAEAVEVLGERCDDVEYVLDLEGQRRRVVVTSGRLVGKSLDEAHLLSRFGVTISRIMRQDVEFVPGPQERIQFGDALTAVGETSGLERFIEFAGHRERTLDETDLISLALGLVLGILLGRVEIAFDGNSFSLGLAGGPLLVGLIAGHFGHVGPIVGRIPRAARLLLSELGLALFLGQAGSQAGGAFVEVIREHGFALPLASMAIVITPMLVGLAVARLVLRIDILETSGGICGAMTSTPGLGAITSNVDSSAPATSYATVYPLALILITLLAPLLISLMD